MASASGPSEPSGKQAQHDDSNSLLRPLKEMKHEELVRICENLEKVLVQKDHQINDINGHCEELMTLYYDTVEKVVKSNQELHTCHERIKKYEHQLDSLSLGSENTDPELVKIANDDEDEDDEYDDDYDEDDEDDDEDDDDEDDEDDDEDDEESDGSSRGTTSPATMISQSTVPSTHVVRYSPRVASGVLQNAGLSQSLQIDRQEDVDYEMVSQSQASLGAALNSSARSRRNSRRSAHSRPDLSEKVHPVLYRRDPNKSMIDVIKAESVGVDADNQKRTESRNHHNNKTNDESADGIHTVDIQQDAPQNGHYDMNMRSEIHNHSIAKGDHGITKEHTTLSRKSPLPAIRSPSSRRSNSMCSKCVFEDRPVSGRLVTASVDLGEMKPLVTRRHSLLRPKSVDSTLGPMKALPAAELEVISHTGLRDSEDHNDTQTNTHDVTVDGIERDSLDMTENGLENEHIVGAMKSVAT